MLNQRRQGQRNSHAPSARTERGERLRAAVAEVLEPRKLMSASPVLHQLNLTSGKASSAKAGAVYRLLNAIGASPMGAAAAVHAKAVAPFHLDAPGLKKKLAGAPLESAKGAEASAVVLPLPMPDGSITRFKVVEAPVMEAGLAAQFPDIKTYRGVGVDDPTASVRLDYTPLGFHAQVLSVRGSYYIDPYYLNDAAGAYTSYYKRDVDKPTNPWRCDIVETGAKLSTQQEAALDGIFADSLTVGSTPLAISYGTQLKTYRAAVAADGEYTTFQGGTVAAGQAAIVTAMNRVTGVYETELDIRLVLVANNSSLVYTNKNTDPYTNTNANSLLNQNQTNIDKVIGSANYDIGHVFTTGGGGLAALGVVGKTGTKAQGETGNPSPTGDSYWIDYVAHEMGHQFGADHTFNTANDTGNRNGPTAYEPGSGSTIMAYAGIEGSEDLQAHSDPYFHSASIDEIRSYITTGTIANVGTTTATGNSAPTVSAGSAYNIPASTPFILTATGSDPNGDTLTYEWQERDLGAATYLTDPDNGTSPILRDWTPSTSSSRIVPRLSNLLSNTLAPGEKLPAVNRASFKWRVIARDNKPGGGGVSTSDVTLAVVNTGSAFAVTSPNTAATGWIAGTSQTVSWNVAGTTGSGINTANVNILLSTDGGNTFPITLAAGTANDGSQAITVPANVTTSSARVKVEAVGNIFFDLSNANFQIAPPGATTGTIAGNVYEDRNADGLPDASPVGMTGVTVFLDNNNSGALDGDEPSVITGANGDFSFSTVTPGAYHVREAIWGFIPTSPTTGLMDLTVSAGGTSSATFLNFPTVFTGTSGADDYRVRIGTSLASGIAYADNFNRAALNGGSTVYTPTVTAGDGGASITNSDVLTLTNDAGTAANVAGTVFVTTPTSAYAGFNRQLHQNTGMLTWSLNMRQARTNPSGFASTNYGAAYILGASNNVFSGSGAGNGYAIVMGNNSSPDPIRLVKFTGGLAGTVTDLTSSAAQDVSNHYFSIKVTYNPATDQWSLFTRDDGTTAFTDPKSGTLAQSGSTVTDSTFTNSTLTHSGALWTYSSGANQTASFDNISLSLPNVAAPRLEILVNDVVTYTAPTGFPTSLSFDLGEGDDLLTKDSTGGAITCPVTFTGGAGVDTWKFIGGTHALAGDVGASADKIELSSGATLNLTARQKFSGLTIGAGSRVNISEGMNHMLQLDTLSVASTGTLDLNDNDLVVNNGDFATIQALVFLGYSTEANATKTGIISTVGQTTVGTPLLALIDNGLVGATDFPFGSGTTVSPVAVCGKFTFAGDVDLNGMVTPDDYLAIDSNLGVNVPPGIGWTMGDFDFNGIVTPDDYQAIDANLGNSFIATSLPREKRFDLETPARDLVL
ncbi:MAG TPA: zinc-dependent metalloprotease family protein [Tepidisphaeraceae bacterium]|jgi:hypothetical protein